jgi:hypothetical protein
LPETIGVRFVHISPDTNVINIQRWALEELNVLPYPEARVYRQIAKALCKRVAQPTDLILLVREQRMFASAPETGYRCWQL